jgi:hypothetical protein
MKVLAVILSLLIFGQSLSVCGPEIAHRDHDHSMAVPEGCKAEIHQPQDVCNANLNTHNSERNPSCCKSIQHENTDHKDHSDEENDCCGDACHCFCCAKVLLSHLPYGVNMPDELPDFSGDPSVVITVNSFDFRPSISNPPQFLHLS